MANISSIGVGSNLPLNDLLNNLRKSENVALERIADQKQLAEARVSAYGILKGSLETLADAAKKLSETETFSASKVAVGGEALSAAGQAGATPGRYDIEVSKLASSQILATQTGQASRSAQIGGEGTGGIISFTIGGQTKTLDLAGQGNSLDDIVKAINSADLGVQATVLNDGSNAPHRLILTAKASGTEAAITAISVTGNTDLNAVLGYDSAHPDANAGMKETAAASDAEVSINGIAVTSHSNTLDNVIDGVSLTLNKTTQAPVSLTVESDLEPAKAAIKKFVEAYNALQDNVANLTRYDTANKRSSVLTGDSLARTLQSRTRGVLDFSMGENAYANLSRIGISTNPNDGHLQISENRLDAALKDNSDAVTRLFSAEGGLAARAQTIVQPMLESNRGLLATSIDGAQKSVGNLEKEYERTEIRIEATMERYRTQFSALDGMVSKMNGISSYLTQQLGMLAANSGKK